MTGRPKQHIMNPMGCEGKGSASGDTANGSCCIPRIPSKADFAPLYFNDMQKADEIYSKYKMEEKLQTIWTESVNIKKNPACLLVIRESGVMQSCKEETSSNNVVRTKGT